MMYFNLDEIDTVFSLTRTWSNKWYSPVKLFRKDYFGDPDRPISDCIKELVDQHLSFKPEGVVCMLTNPRIFQYVINPISIYYCFDKEDNLEAMVLEVTNTPWKEKKTYVLPCNPRKIKQHNKFKKTLYVSPFHDMDLVYDCKSNTPDSKLLLHLDNLKITNEEEEKIFDATLVLNRSEINSKSLRNLLISYPLMTLKVFIGIHIQALKLIIKRVPLTPKPVT